MKPHDDPVVRKENRLFAINRRGKQRIVIIIADMNKFEGFFFSLINRINARMRRIAINGTAKKWVHIERAEKTPKITQSLISFFSSAVKKNKRATDIEKKKHGIHPGIL